MSPLTRRQFIGASAGLVVAADSLALPARGFDIVPRSAWAGDLSPKGDLEREDVEFLIVHHSASHNGHTPSDVPAILRGWYHYHTGPDKGWPDIAYNFIIDSSGGIWEGREGSVAGPVAGSATGGNQGFTQLVCVIGDTNLAPATPAARASLVGVLAWLADRYGVSTVPGAEVTFPSRGSNRWPAGTVVTTPTIAGHRDMSNTTCPGDSLYSYVVGSLTADVEALRSSTSSPGATTSTSVSTTTTMPITTTTVPTTTTTMPTTTTTPGSTPTTVGLTTTTKAVAPSTALPSAGVGASTPDVTGAAPSITVPSATGGTPEGSSPPLGLLTTAGAMALTGAGLLLWRYRRMRPPG